MPYVFNPFTGTFDIVNADPDLSGYVPYTGATTDVNLGTNSLTAGRGNFESATQQVQLKYSTGNECNITVGATGGVTFNAVGTGAEFIFEDPVTAKSTATSPTVTGANVVVNGNPFVAGLAGWTIDTGSGWSNSGVGALHASGNTNTLSQTITVVQGGVYRVQYTVGASGTGGSFTLTVVVDGLTISTNGASGTRTGYFVASSTSVAVVITPSSTHTRLVSAFRVEQMTASTPCFKTDTLGSPAELRASSSNGAVCLGNGAGGFLLTGGTALGQRALASCVNANFNTAFGFEALESCNGQFNTGIGYQAGKRITSGTQNFCAGGAAGTNITSGSNNMALGHQALDSVSTGNLNVGIGAFAGGSLTTGTSNTLVGATSGNSISTGTKNTHIGESAGNGNTTGSFTLTIGSGAQLITDTDYQLSIGDAIVGNMSTRLLGIGLDYTFVPAATWHIESLTEQLRLGYDGSNYFSTTVGATGDVAFNAVGASAGFTFSDPVNITSSLQCDSIVNDTGLAHGTYTPTLTNATNVDSSTARLATYLRVGNSVTVSGQLDIDPTMTATATLLGISLPIASNFSTAFQAGGTAFATGITGMGGGIEADATNDRVSLKFISSDITNQTMAYTFTYQII
jgi:hypothetical protein